MPSIDLTFLSSNTRGVLWSLLIIQIISAITFYHQLSIIKSEVNKQHCNHEQLTSGQSTQKPARFSTTKLLETYDELNNTAIVHKNEFTSDTGQSKNESGEEISTLSNSTVIDEANIAGGNAMTTDSLEQIETVRRYSNILIHQSNWSDEHAKKVGCAGPLQLPIKKIYVGETLTVNCKDYASCRGIVLQQNNRYALHYNFVIGGDGSIFEDQSWVCQVWSHRLYAQSILVSFTSFTQMANGFRHYEDEVNSKQYSSLKLFITANLINGNLSPSYQLLPLCCIIRSSSNPAKLVYTNLTHFENFYGDECVKNGLCIYRN